MDDIYQFAQLLKKRKEKTSKYYANGRKVRNGKLELQSI